jgi:hypothetical protein
VASADHCIEMAAERQLDVIIVVCLMFGKSHSLFLLSCFFQSHSLFLLSCFFLAISSEEICSTL